MNQMWQPECGCRDADWSDLCRSWEQAECLRRIIRRELSGMGGTLAGPIAGVTNGSQALPGQVGEFVQGRINGTLNAPNQQLTAVAVTPLALMPGDWDVVASCQFSLGYPSTITGANLILSPVPTGAQSDMQTWLVANFQPIQELDAFTIVSPRTQINVSVATPLMFSIGVWNWTGAAASPQWALYVTARRMR